MPVKQKLPKPLKDEADEYSRLSVAAKEAGNAANRQKTKLRNAVKAHWTENELPIGSFIHAGGMEIKYETNVTTKIDPESVMKLYEEGEITREQFLRMVTIGVTEAKNVIGGDQVADFTVEVPGKNVDIRLADLPVENQDDEFVLANHAPKKRNTRRKVFGSGAKTKPRNAAVRKRPTRKIKSKVSKS